MPGKKAFDIEIDKLTRSIENAITGDKFKTQVSEVNATELKKLKKSEWLLDWKAEAKKLDRKVYKPCNR